MAADVERLISREGVSPGEVVVLVPAISREGQAVAVAFEERAIPHRVVGQAAFFQRAEIRDLLAWLRLLADASNAAAVVRALARPPIELRSVDIARCTQIARRRKLDMVAALAAATESPQVPPEARERIMVFLKLYRSGVAAIDTTRPDLYVHRLIDRLGLRRHQLFPRDGLAPGRYFHHLDALVNRADVVTEAAPDAIILPHPRLRAPPDRLLFPVGTHIIGVRFDHASRRVDQIDTLVRRVGAPVMSRAGVGC